MDEPTERIISPVKTYEIDNAPPRPVRRLVVVSGGVKLVEQNDDGQILGWNIETVAKCRRMLADRGRLVTVIPVHFAELAELDYRVWADCDYVRAVLILGNDEAVSWKIRKRGVTIVIASLDNYGPTRETEAAVLSDLIARAASMKTWESDLPATIEAARARTFKLDQLWYVTDGQADTCAAPYEIQVEESSPPRSEVSAIAAD